MAGETENTNTGNASANGSGGGAGGGSSTSGQGGAGDKTGTQTSTSTTTGKTTGTESMLEVKTSTEGQGDKNQGDKSKADDKAKDDKQGQGDKDKGQPAELQLKLPEGLDPKAPEAVATVERVKAFAKAHGLNAAQAQAAADELFKTVEADRKAIAEYDAQQKSWADAVRADPEIGGKNLDASLNIARGAVACFGGAELGKVLTEAGLGVNPVVVKAFVKIGKAIAEDSISGSENAAPKTAKNDEETFHRALFPTMFNGQGAKP